MPLQYCELRRTNGWDLLASLGHPSKFQRVSRLGLSTAPTSLNKGQQNFVRFWPSPGLVHYIYTFGGSCPKRNFARCKIHFASKSCFLLYCRHYWTALEQWASAKLCGVLQGMELRNFWRRRHLYSARQSSRWASARILVCILSIPHVGEIKITVVTWTVAEELRDNVTDYAKMTHPTHFLWHFQSNYCESCSWYRGRQCYTCIFVHRCITSACLSLAYMHGRCHCRFVGTYLNSIT